MSCNIISLIIILCYIIPNLRVWSKGELFTAISDVEPLLDVHKKITDDLDNYILKEEQRLSTLKRHLEIYKKENEIAMEDIPNYLGNPLNAFTLIKRLTTDLDYIEKNLATGTQYVKNLTIPSDKTDVKYPTMNDLTGAAQALSRLQETYHLQIKDLAEGVLNGLILSDDGTSAFDNDTAAVSTISADDCFVLGKALYQENEHKNALSWMMEALRKMKKENQTYTFTEVDVMEYISYIHYLLGDDRNALEWTKKILVLDPTHAGAQKNLKIYQSNVDEKDRKLKEKQVGIGEDTDGGNETVADDDPSSYPYKKKIYEALCRGEIDVPREVAKKLRCQYLTENHPFLKLAPIKMEYLFHSPDIIIFHGVMSDNEIEEIKALARPKFYRATVMLKSGEMVPANYRISKSGWLLDEESPVVARISRRVMDFTGLSLDTAEQLQVVNYGIGGHYEPHYDFSLKSERGFKESKGNRIATVLFYMSDVPLGGATVFTELGLRVSPIRGAAAFWLNLHPSGEGDTATYHASCPVLRGSKWVSNKWIHQVGQEFIKPCDKEYQQEGIHNPIPPPVPRSTLLH